MLEDLKGIHSTLLDAYKSVLALTGVDVDAVTGIRLPTRHLPI
jgi:hypothetical protein